MFSRLFRRDRKSAPTGPANPDRRSDFMRRWGWPSLVGACSAVLASAVYLHYQPAPPAITQDDIDAAVVKAIETQNLPSRQAIAAEKIRTAVVRVRGFTDEAGKPGPEDSTAPAVPAPGSPQGRSRPGKEASPHSGKPESRRQGKSSEDGGDSPSARKDGTPSARKDGKPSARGSGKDKDTEAPQEGSVGSGVLISEDGVILTNLHVVAGSKRIMVTFFDGFETEAVVVGLRPDNDLAIIRAKKLPDDIEPATLGGSGGLKPGDEVVAVGFPFGMGPSVSAGVVSGLNREFRSPTGGKSLSGLIQFDAAANPGNSGGPLINLAGEVVGIVTAIFNPSGSRTFIGIGFAVTMEAAGNAVGIPPL